MTTIQRYDYCLFSVTCHFTPNTGPFMLLGYVMAGHDIESEVQLPFFNSISTAISVHANTAVGDPVTRRDLAH